jgi:hypothetical protein
MRSGRSGFTPTLSVAVFVAAGAGLWVELLYANLRLFGCGKADAWLLAAAASVSAAGVFWLATPETQVIRSATLLAALLVAALADRRWLSDTALMLMSALTLSIALTNWMAGVAMTLVHRRRPRALQISVNAFALVVVLWGVRRLVVPRGDFFIGYRSEQRHLLRSEAGTVFERLRVLLFHSMVMPEIATADTPGRPAIMSVQHAKIAHDLAAPAHMQLSPRPSDSH